MRTRCGVKIAVLGTFALTACGGGDDVAEGVFERIAEQQLEAEGGGDVDFDFGNGEFSIRTEDGEFRVQTDADGNVQIQGSGGSGDEAFTIEGDGDQTVIETEDGQTVFEQGQDLPDDFPSDIPLPDDASLLFAQSSNTPTGSAWILSGTAPGDFGELTDGLVAALESGGYEQQQVTTSPTGNVIAYRSDSLDVYASFAPDGDNTGFQVTVTERDDG